MLLFGELNLNKIWKNGLLTGVSYKFITDSPVLQQYLVRSVNCTQKQLFAAAVQVKCFTEKKVADGVLLWDLHACCFYGYNTNTHRSVLQLFFTLIWASRWFSKTPRKPFETAGVTNALHVIQPTGSKH